MLQTNYPCSWMKTTTKTLARQKTFGIEEPADTAAQREALTSGRNQPFLGKRDAQLPPEVPSKLNSVWAGGIINMQYSLSFHFDRPHARYSN